MFDTIYFFAILTSMAGTAGPTKYLLRPSNTTI